MSACRICSHERRAQIELGLVLHTPLDTLARRFDVSRDSLWRHKQNHLTPQLRAAILAGRKPAEIDLQALEISESESLLSQLVTQRGRLQVYAEQAMDLGDVRSAVAVERVIVENLQTVGKLLGQLTTRHEVKSVSLLVSADYLALRQAITTALRSFPEAGRAVARALFALESEAAKEITEASKTAPQPTMVEAAAQ